MTVANSIQGQDMVMDRLNGSNSMMRLEPISAARAANVRRSRHGQQREMMQSRTVTVGRRRRAKWRGGECNAGRVEYRHKKLG